MQEYAQKPEKSSSESNHKSSGQPPISEILQAYKNGTLQRMSVDEEELLQAKTRDKSSERETLQLYTEYTHRDKSRYNSLIQGMFDIPQRKGVGNEEPLQGKFDSSSAASESTVQREVKPNNTGLPDNLKSGIENLSGYSLDDVKVHYNSDKPAQLSALAYAQGTDIHVAPGQEKHLPHEAWHVVQQMQGRVQPTVESQGININDNKNLEKEADIMGNISSIKNQNSSILQKKILNKNTIQRTVILGEEVLYLTKDEIIALIKDENIKGNAFKIISKRIGDTSNFYVYDSFNEFIEDVKNAISTGKESQKIGKQREEDVAKQIGGDVADMGKYGGDLVVYFDPDPKRANQRHVKLDVIKQDIFGIVGGGAKAENLQKFRSICSDLKAISEVHGKTPKVYYASNTPSEVINAAKEIVGTDNVELIHTSSKSGAIEATKDK